MTLTGKIFTFFLVVVSLIYSGQTHAQGTLSGVIKDAGSKETLIGATVMIVGTYKGSATDIDGKYSITDVKAGDYSIKVSFIGYADKIFNGIHIADGETTTLNAELSLRSQTLQAVEIVGEKNLIDLEAASSEVKISQEALSEMNARDVTEVASMQAGVNKTTDGISIRGGRVYETQYVVDGISVEDPLAGTGAGVSVASSSIQDIQITTGGSGADQGGGMAGVISTKIREGGDKFQIGGSWTRDNLGFDANSSHAWNTDIMNLNLGGAIPGTKKKLRYFLAFDASLSDDYFGPTANQLHSSLLPSNDSIWAPRYI